MSLKVLADKVLERDTIGTVRGTELPKPSHGVILPFPAEIIEAYEERTAIMEYDANLSCKKTEKAVPHGFSNDKYKEN